MSPMAKKTQQQNKTVVFPECVPQNIHTDSVNTDHATQLATLVSPARTFLVAAFLAGEDKFTLNRKKHHIMREVGGDLKVLLKSCVCV